jgi:transposase-like protein
MIPNQQIREQIVADYKAGKRVQDIENEHGLKRATLYYILDQAGILPDRANRGEKLKGNTEQLAALFELLSAQETYVASLEKLLNDNGITIPEKFLG